MDGWTRLAPYLAVVDRCASDQNQDKKGKSAFVLTRFGHLQVVLAHPPESLALSGPRQEGIQMIGYSIIKVRASG